MTQLEKKIYDRAMDIIPELLEKVKDMKIESRFIEFPFLCEGCIDRLHYDTELKRFTKILYRKGKGKGMRLEGQSEYAGYFDDAETLEIELTNNESYEPLNRLSRLI